MNASAVLDLLQSFANPAYLPTMERFGIPTDHALGIGVTSLRAVAKGMPRCTSLACELWRSGIHEARILATILAMPKDFSAAAADSWVADFNSWDICDIACSNLFRKTSWAEGRIAYWASCEPEFTRRAGFALLATMAGHRNDHRGVDFSEYLELILSYSTDDRPMVKKAVNWALREIGKRSPELHPLALDTARKIGALSSRSARWIAADAIRELNGLPVRKRLGLQA